MKYSDLFKGEHLIAKYIVTSAEASFDISLVNKQRWRRLRVIGRAKNTANNGNVNLRFSTDGVTPDTAGNYKQNFIYGGDSAASASTLETDASTVATAGRATNNTDCFGYFDFTIPFYSRTDGQKQMSTRYNAKESNTMQTTIVDIVWANNDAIKGLHFISANNNFDVGTEVYVYGSM